MIKDLTGSSSECRAQFNKECVDFLGKVQSVTCFLNSENFLITPSSFPSPFTGLLLKGCTGNEVHIEGANCGYFGEGPRTTMSLLKEVGIQSESLEKIEKLVFSQPGVQFDVNEEGYVNWDTLRMDVLFVPTFGARYTGSIDNYIVLNRSTQVSLYPKELLLFNPQYNCYSGFLRAISYAKPRRMLYHVGPDSPLLNRFSYRKIKKPYEAAAISSIRSPEEHCNMDNIDEVNLELVGDRFTIGCLIDCHVQLQTIESVYMYLFHKRLFNANVYRQSRSRWLMRELVQIDGVLPVPA